MYYYCANQVAYNTTQPGGVGYSSGDQPSCTGKLSELRCTLTTTTAGELKIYMKYKHASNITGGFCWSLTKVQSYVVSEKTYKSMHLNLEHEVIIWG